MTPEPTTEAEIKAVSRHGWSDERVALLKALWTEGLSGSQIAARLNVTRNTVIGKVHRLNLACHAVHVRAPRIPSERPSCATLAPKAAPAPVSLSKVAMPLLHVIAPPVTRPAPSGGVSFMDLKSDSCRWPIGEVGTPGFHFCGAGALSEHPYCAAHTKLARGYGTPSERDAIRAALLRAKFTGELVA